MKNNNNIFNGQGVAKRTISFILIFVLMLSLTFSLTGCIKKESKVDQAIEYMEKKYDDTFTFDHYVSGDSNSIVILKSEKIPDAKVQVDGNKLEDGTYDFYDNYVDCKYEKETRQYLKELFESIFGCEVKVLPHDGFGVRLSKQFDDKTTLDEFIHSPYNSLGDCVMVSSDFKIQNKNTGKILSELKEKISKSRIILSCLIYFCKNQEEFDLGLKNSTKERLDMPQLRISMNDYDKYLILKWRNI